MSNELKMGTPIGRPAIIVVIGVLLLFIAFVLSPQLLIQLGPMRGSLTSELGNVRVIAEAEIMAARLLIAIAGLVLVAIWVFWRQFSVSRLNRWLVTPLQVKEHGALFNRPAFYMLSATALILGWIAIAGIYPQSLPRVVRREDGLFEYLTALLFLGASVTAFLNARKARRQVERFVLYSLAIGFLVCVAEEISWGQRLFGFETPENLQAFNVQDEINLHNSLGYAADHIFIAGVFLYGVLLPILVRRYTAFANLAFWTGLPVASLGLALGWAAASGLHDWTVYYVLPKTPLRVAEAREMISALGFFLLMLEIRKKLRG
ncbi:MAG: hypothetical protein V3V25_13110 [Paracoccaceae bacterium]